MKDLIALLVLTIVAANKVESHVCSDGQPPELYPLAKNISSYPRESWEKIPETNITADIHFSDIIDTVKEFVSDYEEASRWLDCKKMLKQVVETDFVYVADEHPIKWSKIPKKLQKDLETFFDSAELAFYDRKPKGAFCKAILTQVNREVGKAKALTKIKVDKFPKVVQEMAGIIQKAIKRWAGVDKTKCSRTEYMANLFGAIGATGLYQFKDEWKKVPAKELKLFQDWFRTASDLEDLKQSQFPD